MDIYQMRIGALRRLIGTESLKEFADRYDLDPSYLSQILNGHRNLGEKAAANMEAKIGCPSGVLIAPAVAQGAHEQISGDDLRAGFVQRLKKAVADKGIPEWGAGARLAKITAVTPKATSKWLNGEAIPSPANLLAIATELGVRREWLEYGEGNPQADGNVSPTTQPNRYYRFPVVSSVVAGGWGDAIQAYEPGAEDRFEKTDTKVKGPAFWLEVEGDSMTSLSGPSIPEGMLILVDTGIEPQPGHLVVAKLETEEKATFKKLVQDGGKLYLKPLNTGYNPIEINGNCRIIGVVREAKMKLL